MFGLIIAVASHEIRQANLVPLDLHWVNHTLSVMSLWATRVAHFEEQDIDKETYSLNG